MIAGAYDARIKNLQEGAQGHFDASHAFQEQYTDHIRQRGVRLAALNPDQSAQTSEAGGVFVYRERDGSTTHYYPNQMVENRQQNGTTVIKQPSGEIDTIWPNLEMEAKFPDKTRVHVWPNGDKKVTLPDGTTKYYWPDGQWEVKHPGPTGDREHGWPDGYVEVTHPGGKKEHYYIDENGDRLPPRHRSKK
jgi:hypothetical protein